MSIIIDPTTASRVAQDRRRNIVASSSSSGYQVEGNPPVTLKAGEVLFIPAGTIHAAKNVGSGNGAELAPRMSSKKGSRSS